MLIAHTQCRFKCALSAIHRHCTVCLGNEKNIAKHPKLRYVEDKNPLAQRNSGNTRLRKSKIVADNKIKNVNKEFKKKPLTFKFKIPFRHRVTYEKPVSQRAVFSFVAQPQQHNQRTKRSSFRMPQTKESAGEKNGTLLFIHTTLRQY